MSALAATTILRRYPEAALTVVNRTPERAERLAAAVNGKAAPLSALPSCLADADLILSCTGATELVLTQDQFIAARAGSSAPVTLIDLALPRDLDPAIGELPGTRLIDLELIAETQKAKTADGPAGDSLDEVTRIVEAEVEAYRKVRTANTVAPTVTALRCMAAEVVAAELNRFHSRTAGLDERTRAEVEQTVRRVVDKLLHEPTVRVKQLAVADGGVTYAQALRELFNLDPRTAVAVSRAVAAGDGTAAEGRPADGTPTEK